MKKFFASLLGVLLLAAIIIGVFAVILLADAGLLHLLGVRYDSLGWLLAYVAISAVVGWSTCFFPRCGPTALPSW